MRELRKEKAQQNKHGELGDKGKRRREEERREKVTHLHVIVSGGALIQNIAHLPTELSLLEIFTPEGLAARSQTSSAAITLERLTRSLPIARGKSSGSSTSKRDDP